MNLDLVPWPPFSFELLFNQFPYWHTLENHLPRLPFTFLSWSGIPIMHASSQFKGSLVLWIGIDDSSIPLSRTINRNHTWISWTRGKCLLYIPMWLSHGFQRSVGHRDASLLPSPFLTPCPVMHITVTNLISESQFFSLSDRSSPGLLITQSTQEQHLPTLWIYQNVSFLLLLWPYLGLGSTFCSVLVIVAIFVTLVWCKHPLLTSYKSQITHYKLTS